MSLSEMPECLMKLIRRKFFSHDLYFLQEIPHRYMSVSLIQVIVISAYWFYCLTTFASQNGDAVLEKHELIYRLALMAAPMPVILYLTYFAVNFLCRFLHFQTTLYDRSGEDSWMAVSELFSSLRERDGGMYGILGVRPTAESGQSAFVVRRIQKKYLFPAVVRTNLRNVPSFGDPDRTMYFILPDQLLLANDDYRFVAGIPWSDIRIVCEEKLMRDPLSGENMETPVPVSAIRLECGRWSTGLLIRGTDSNFIELGMLLLKMRMSRRRTQRGRRERQSLWKLLPQKAAALLLLPLLCLRRTSASMRGSSPGMRMSSRGKTSSATPASCQARAQAMISPPEYQMMPALPSLLTRGRSA